MSAAALLEEMPSIQIKLGPGDAAPWNRPTVTAVRNTFTAVDRTSSGVRHLLKTACGKPLNAAYASREESYVGHLCLDGCFTAYELLEAKQLLTAERDERLAHASMQTDLGREEVRRRLAAGKFPSLVAVIDDDADPNKEKP